MKCLIPIFILAVLISCTNQKGIQGTKASFSTRHFFLPSDTTVRSIAYLNGYLLLLQDNGKFIVLDTNYKRIDSLERKFLPVKFAILIRYNDTLFLEGNDKIYFLNSDFSQVGYDSKQRRYGNVLFEDSAYLVYGCCAGEWGGSVFFLAKHTKRTFSYMATCATQVLRFGQSYVVCNNLAHLSEHMSFLVVNDPTTLYEITDEKQKNTCNWYTTVDSLKNYWEISKKGEVQFYEARNATSLVSFLFKDSLYSILSVPKATVLVIHRSDSIILEDTLIDKKIPFHESEVIDAGNKKVCLYSLTEGSPFAAYLTRGNTSGLIVVSQNRIDFVDKRK